MSEHKTINGRCLCGAVTVTLTDPAGWVGVCHCRMCRQWSGGIWAGFPAEESTVKVTGPVQIYASSELADRAFCQTCGSQLWMRDRKEGAVYDMMPGLFDEASGWPLKSEVYADQAMNAMALKGDHPRATAQEYQAKNPDVKGLGE